MQRTGCVACKTGSKFQSSPAPKGRCNAWTQTGGSRLLNVSILTGPEGPMQPQQTPNGLMIGLVSILTGPEGPMQPKGLRVLAQCVVFQSSPAPKGRCNGPSPRQTTPSACFNPHRPRRADATCCRSCLRICRSVSILTGPEGPMQHGVGGADRRAGTVSILTGPEGPMQRRVR